jgi:hypothetical protein
MALRSKQRTKLPDSAFAYPSRRSFPVPTAAQAKRAGISRRTHMGMMRSALSRAGQSHTRGTYAHVAALVKRRSPEKIATIHGPRGTTARAGKRAASGGRARARTAATPRAGRASRARGSAHSGARPATAGRGRTSRARQSSGRKSR